MQKKYIKYDKGVSNIIKCFDNSYSNYSLEPILSNNQGAKNLFTP